MTRTKTPAHGNIIMLLLTLWMVSIGLLLRLGVLYRLGIEPIGIWRQAFVHIVGLLIPFIVYVVITKQKLGNVLMLKAPTVKNAVLAALMGVAVMPMGWFFGALAAELNRMFFDAGTELVGTVLSPALWLMILIGAVLPTITEESWFRGVFFNYYHKHTSIAKTVLITSLFFALMHGNVTQIMVGVPMGIVFAYSLHYTRSIWVPAVIHLVHNALANTIGYFALTDSPNTAYDYAQTAISEANYIFAGGLEEFLFFAIAALIVAPFIFLIMRAFKKYHSRTQSSVSVDLKSDETTTKTNSPVITWAFWASIAIWVAFSLLRGFGVI